jgi:hypothetical protein
MLTIADRLYIDTNGNIGIGTSPTVSLDFSNRSDGIIIPRGTTAQRPSVAYNGMMRFNTDASINTVEMYINNGWRTASSSRPAIISVAQTSLYDNVVVGVNGSFFEETQKWSLIGKDGTIYYPTVQFYNASYVTIQAPNDISSGNTPYVIKVHSKRSGLDFISPTIRFELSPISYLVPIITSARPADISQNVYSSSYSAPYTFTATGGNITWSLTSYKRTDASGNISWTDISNSFGNINSVTSQLTLLFPQYTLASGYFIVAATNTLGFQDISWNYNVVGQFKPVVTPSSVSTLNKSTNQGQRSESYTFTATGGAITWSNTPDSYGFINQMGQLSLTFAQNTTANGVMTVTAANEAGTTDVSWNFNVINTLYTVLDTGYVTGTFAPSPSITTIGTSTSIPANTEYVEGVAWVTAKTPSDDMYINFDVYDGLGNLGTTTHSIFFPSQSSRTAVMYFALNKSVASTYVVKVRTTPEYLENAVSVTVTYRYQISYC